ncbi:hypothetical protein [Flavobacterium daejeonense]|uniref:hypothetical protein n=1 Tax=Flavobacterium daejeonense TaxID=350893 RepID=UPI0012DD08C9|nr:hypothetical protein [Flavobacterium daejeonense]
MNSVLSPEQQAMHMGGIDPIVTCHDLTGGGTVESWDLGGTGSYSIVTAPDGKKFVFDGVRVADGGLSAYTSSDGVVHIGSGLTIDEFIHEYGHYLQSLETNSFGYYGTVGLESGYKNGLEFIGIDSEYYSTGYENDASNRGNSYMGYYYPNSGYVAPTTP